MEFARIYRITERDGTRIMLHPEFGDKEPEHVDMLRYDLAFCDPQDIARVVFPIFNSRKAGRTTSKITIDRWRSFGLLVETIEKDVVDPGKWTTYRHENGDPLRPLVPQTLDEYLKAHPGEKIAGWR